MKTKLLIFALLFISFLGFSQISFSNPLTTAIASTSATVSSTINISCPNGATYYLQFSTSPTFSSNFSSFNFTTTHVKSVNLTSLSPSTTYYWRFYGAYSTAASCDGTVVYQPTQSFTTASSTVITPALVASYNFDNTYNDVNGANPFSSQTGVTLVSGRNAAAGQAININGVGSIATIPGLPYGGAARTVSYWVKLNAYASTNFNFNFAYGAGSTNNAFGGSFINNRIDFLGYSNNFSVYPTYSQFALVWYHLTYTYDGTTVKIYKDGQLMGSDTKSLDTVNNANLFKLGTGVGSELNFNGTIDDLKIYNYALTPSQVLSVYTNNAVLATTENNIKSTDISIYPNPAKDFVNIQSDIKVQSAEIYNMAGQKVLETKESKINISKLKSGIYMIQIKDVKNQTVTKKFIKQ